MKPIFAFSAAITAITLCTPAEARQTEAVLHVSAVVEESCSASADRCAPSFAQISIAMKGSIGAASAGGALPGGAY